MPPASTLPEPLLRRLIEAVGSEHVLVAPELRAGYERDWSGRYGAPSRAVVRPGTAAEVVAVVTACVDAAIAIVPQGGNTGLVGGGVPRGGEIVLSTRRLAWIGDVDAGTRTVTVGAGATLASVAAVAARAGLEVGVDLASRDAATIGGMVSTDAGGTQVLAHGRMRDRVVSLKAIAADGRLIDGPAAELAGAEGTLAIITEVTLRLVPQQPCVAAALIACPDGPSAVALVQRLRQTLGSLNAIELMEADGLEVAARHLGEPAPFRTPSPVTVLVECRAPVDPLDELAAALDACGVADADVIVAADPVDRRRLWAIRDIHGEAAGTLGVTHRIDVAIPDDALAAFLDRVRPAVAVAWPAARTFVFGHVGVGNLHVIVVGPPRADDDALLGVVLRQVAEVGGDVVGEHGAGIAKTRWLPLSRSADELARTAARKHAYDPAGLFNPGVVAGARIAPLPSAG
jgi:FAD/FMN-containing dehydrogenase